MADGIVATVDAKKRIRIPDAKPGQQIFVLSTSEGSWTLKEVRPPEDKPVKARLVKRNGYTVIESDRPFDAAAVKAALEEFP